MRPLFISALVRQSYYYLALVFSSIDFQLLFLFFWGSGSATQSLGFFVCIFDLWLQKSALRDCFHFLFRQSTMQTEASPNMFRGLHYSALGFWIQFTRLKHIVPVWDWGHWINTSILEWVFIAVQGHPSVAKETVTSTHQISFIFFLVSTTVLDPEFVSCSHSSGLIVGADLYQLHWWPGELRVKCHAQGHKSKLLRGGEQL